MVCDRKMHVKKLNEAPGKHDVHDSALKLAIHTTANLLTKHL